MKCHSVLFCQLFLILFLTGCAGSQFRIQTLAKSEMDMVADTHLTSANDIMRELAIKLYARNPVQLKKTDQSVEERLHLLFNIENHHLRFNELDDKAATELISLALDDNFEGDRVFALMVGLTDMIRSAYDNKPEFFIIDQLDEQKLYNSARNVEILTWRLRQPSEHSNLPLILTNATGDEINLSFERLFGKLIANQDMMALLISQKNHRAIRSAAHTIGSMAFLPI